MEKITKIIQKIVNLTHKQLSGQMLYWEQQQVLEVGQMLYWEQQQVLRVVLAVVLVNVEVRTISDHYVRPST